MPGRMKILCSATTRKGTPCGCKAMGNGLCRYHGGKGPTKAEIEKNERARLKLRRAAKNWLHST